jgi:hypothetical protein
MNTFGYTGGNPLKYIDKYGLVQWTKAAFGVMDFTVSTGEALTGMGIMLSSTATGPAAPAVFIGGLGVSAHGVAGMINSGIAVQNALYDTNGPGLFEYIGGELFGEEGAKGGSVCDTFSGIRPSAIAAGSIDTVLDLYQMVSGVNQMESAFNR